MTTNEIKKSLYKQKPTAYLLKVTSMGILYSCEIEKESMVYFLIPLHELGEATFYLEMEAKHLIRWII